MLHSVFVLSTSPHSDLKRTKLHPMLKMLIVDAFVAKWKKDDDPNGSGRKMYGPDNVHSVELIETILDNAAHLEIVNQQKKVETITWFDSPDSMRIFITSSNSAFTHSSFNIDG